MAHRQYFRFVFKIPSIGGTSLVTPMLSPTRGEEYHYERITARNETTAGMDLLIGENSDKGFILLDIIDELPKDTLGVGEAREIVIKASEKLELRIRDATAGDKITLTASGYVWSAKQAGL